MKAKISILLFALFFGIVSPLLQTESFIENLNILRRSYVLAEKQNTETIFISAAAWNKTDNKNELFFNNQYYDVKNSTTQNNNFVKITIVKDGFENVIKNSLQNSGSKRVKSKIAFSVYTTFEIVNKITCLFKSTIQNVISKFVRKLHCDPFVYLQIKPPIFK